MKPIFILESENPPLSLRGALGKIRELTKKWLLQEAVSYVPVIVEKPAHLFVSSMIPRSNDKPVDSRPGVDQTWSLIAALIKQQEQLDISQQTADIIQDTKKTVTSAFITNEEIIRKLMIIQMMTTSMIP
jgi:hypothetical protein